MSESGHKLTKDGSFSINHVVLTDGDCIPGELDIQKFNNLEL